VVHAGLAGHMAGMTTANPDQDTLNGRTAAYRWLIAHGTPTVSPSHIRGPGHDQHREWQDHIAVCGIADEVLRYWPDADVEHSGGGWSGCPGIGAVTFGAYIYCRCDRPATAWNRSSPRCRTWWRRCSSRACLLIADAVVDDDRGQGDAAEVGQS